MISVSDPRTERPGRKCLGHKGCRHCRPWPECRRSPLLRFDHGIFAGKCWISAIGVAPLASKSAELRVPRSSPASTHRMPAIFHLAGYGETSMILCESSDRTEGGRPSAGAASNGAVPLPTSGMRQLRRASSRDARTRACVQRRTTALGESDRGRRGVSLPTQAARGTPQALARPAACRARAPGSPLADAHGARRAAASQPAHVRAARPSSAGRSQRMPGS